MIHGVGYNSGKYSYPTTCKGKKLASYVCWVNMLVRCYKPLPKYEDCVVCREWHDFQEFAKWYEANYVEGYELDKDFKVEGNRVYSPETCMFIPASMNSKLGNNKSVEKCAKTYTLKSPTGLLVTFTNMCEFCRDNGLQQSNLVRVADGTRASHKGWTKPTEQEIHNRTKPYLTE